MRKKEAVFSYYVGYIKCYGVAEIDKNGNVLPINEKLKNPKRNYAIVELYFYTNDV